MLKELSKHNNFFKSVAINICKDAQLADDLVQEMYIKIYETNSTILNPKYYAIQIIKNLFIKECNRNKPIYIEDCLLDIEDSITAFNPDDTEDEILCKAKNLNFLQLNLLKESYDKSLREIEKEFDVRYITAHRELKKARKTILGDDYKKDYNNKRRKRHG